MKTYSHGICSLRDNQEDGSLLSISPKELQNTYQMKTFIFLDGCLFGSPCIITRRNWPIRFDRTTFVPWNSSKPF